MNYWTEESLNLANQTNYLDMLYKVYPMASNKLRELPKSSADIIRKKFENNDNKEMIKQFILSSKKEKLAFPIKDSYVAYLKRDEDAIDRNPETVNRLSGILYEKGIEESIKSMTKPIESNRQIGPLFKRWIDNGSLGVKITSSENDFINSKENIVFNSNDDEIMGNIARKHLGYNVNKGLDFLGKFNDTYVIGEAKFLTDFGGHQNDQMNDAFTTLRTDLKKTNKKVKRIAILDGVLYIGKSNGKMQKALKNASDNEVIISALLLRNYLFSL